MIGYLLLALASGLQAWDVKVTPPDVPPAVKAKKKQAQEEPMPKPTRDDLTRASFDWDVQFAPDRDLYRTYLADPRQSKSGSKVQYSLRRDSESNNVKIENVLGGHRPLVGWTDAAHPDQEMQLQIEAAVFSRFDISEQWDMDAADYRFGFPFLFRSGDVILKVHPYHITSHLGDEYISREDAKRDSYHLNELAVGVSWPFNSPIRVYGELGIAMYAGPETDSGRAQVGAEWIFEPLGKSRVAPFVALDLQTRNEIDWSWNATAMTGLMLMPKSGSGNGLRGTLEYYRGNDAQTQFKGEREHYVALGFAADF